MKNNYYFTSFFWSTTSKIFEAIIQFISVPLLLKYFGIENYGILTLALAANSAMIFLDLGINVGAVKYYSQWRSENKNNLIKRVSGTSISFYLIIGFFNSIILVIIIIWGESFFNLTESQFIDFKKSLMIIACFSIWNWIATIFTQLLISVNMISFTLKISIFTSFLKLILVLSTVYIGLTLNQYFFLFNLIVSIMFIPNYLRSKKLNLIDNLIPKFYWTDFKLVFKYSLAIFVLNFFRIFASNSRPIILGMFAENAAFISSEYKIISVFPGFILTIGGAITSILLPKASQIVANNNIALKENLAYRGTLYTSILSSILCFSVALCSEELISLYVGSQFAYLGKWMEIWSLTLLFSLHTTPCNSLILATGQTKPLVIMTIIACLISVFANIILTPIIGVASPVLTYLLYVLIVVFFNYVYNYKNILDLSIVKLLGTFFKPAFTAFLPYIILRNFVALEDFLVFGNNKVSMIIFVFIKALIWGFFYLFLLLVFKIISINEILVLMGFRSPNIQNKNE